MSDSTDFLIRRARPDEAERVAALIDSVWAGSIRERRPYLFIPRRMADYVLYESAGELWGVVGAYPYDVRIHGVTFRMAGIGQVITRPDRRGRGVMTALLDRALGDLRADGVEAAWLSGDRLRYSRFGFVPGGRALRFVTSARYLPTPPPEGAVRRMDLVRELDRVQQARSALPTSVLMHDDELALALGSFGVSGLALGESFALFNGKGDRMLLASGPPDDVALLLAHQAAASGQHDITFETPAAPCPLAEMGRRVAARASVVPCALFSVVALQPFAKKAAGPGWKEARGMTALQVSEAFFDWLPGAARLPGVEPLDFQMTHFDHIIP